MHSGSSSMTLLLTVSLLWLAVLTVLLTASLQHATILDTVQPAGDHTSSCPPSALDTVTLGTVRQVALLPVSLQVKTAEGFSKRELFQKLAPLEEATRPIMAKARATLQQKKSTSALQPWNISYSLSGALY